MILELYQVMSLKVNAVNSFRPTWHAFPAKQKPNTALAVRIEFRPKPLESPDGLKELEILVLSKIHACRSFFRIDCGPSKDVIGTIGAILEIRPL